MPPKASPADETLHMLQLLQTFRRGEILQEGNDALQDVITAIRQFGGKGKLTLTLNFKMEKGDQISLTPDIKTEKPRRALSTGLYFATEDGGLTRRDPNQAGMFDDEVAARRRADLDD